MTRGYFSADLASTLQMKPHVPEGARNRGRFLHSEEAPERPFAVVLLDILTEPDSAVCQHVHALVFTVVCACPTRQAQVEWEGRGWVTMITIARRDAVLELGGPVS